MGKVFKAMRLISLLHMKPIKISYDKPIKSFFPNDREVLICLFPFYYQVFADNYNWQGNLDKTFPLLDPINWRTISKDIGFNSLERLALGVLGQNNTLRAELEEYCQWKFIDFSDYAMDKIPEVVLVPLIRYCQSMGVKELEVRPVDRFPDSEFKTISVEQRNTFEIYSEIENAKFISFMEGFDILLTDYDCPYAIISGEREKCSDIISNCNLECIEATEGTQFDWWS